MREEAPLIPVETRKGLAWTKREPYKDGGFSLRKRPQVVYEEHFDYADKSNEINGERR